MTTATSHYFALLLMGITGVAFNNIAQQGADRRTAAHLLQQGDLLFFTAQPGCSGRRVVLYAALTGQLDVHSVGGTPLACMVHIVRIGGVCAMIFWNMGARSWGRAGGHLPQYHAAGGRCPGTTLLGEDFAFREAFGVVGILGGVYILTHSRQIMRRMDQRLIRRARERQPAGCGKGIPPGLRPVGHHASKDRLRL